MGESQPVGVEKLTFQPGGAGEGVGPAVERIPGHRASGGGGVDPDLVGAAGQKFQLQEGGSEPGADDFPVGAGRPSLGTYGHFLAVDGVSADGTFPRPHLTFGAAQNKGEVGLLGLPILELAAEFAVGGIAFGGHENSGSFEIKPVDDAGPVGSAAGGKLSGAVVEQGGGEGTGGSSGTGVNGQSGRFVQDNHIGVLMQNVQRNGFGFHMAGHRMGDADDDFRSGGQQGAWLDRGSGGGHTVVFHPLLDFVARFAAEPGEDEIGPLVAVGRAHRPAPDPFLG